jgi:hypothetical protein
MGNIDYASIKADQEAQAQSLARDVHNQAVWDAVLNKFWLADCDANYGIVLSWCGGKVLTFEAIADLLRSKRQDVTLVPVTPGELADEICDQMTHRSDWDKKQFKLRLGTYSLAQLRGLIRKFRAQRAITTKEQAVAVLKATGPKPPRFPGVPQLLSKTFIKETFQWVETPRYVHELMVRAHHGTGTEGQHAIWELKRLCRVYGTDQVNFYAKIGAEKAQAEALSND